MTADLLCPTDRGHPSSLSGVGVDTVAVIGPTTGGTLDELSRLSYHRLVDRRTGEVTDYGHSGFHSIDIGGARVGISAWVDEFGPKMRVQASIPRLMRGHNWDGIGFSELSGAVGQLLSGVADELPGTPRLEEVRVTRLDLTRDFFDVRDASATLAAVARHPMARATINRHDYRVDGTSIQTLTRGNPTHWQARGYDKWFESAHSRSGLQRDMAASRPTQLRFEVELKSKELRYRRLTTIGALMDSDLVALTRLYFERCNFHVNTAQTGLADLTAALRSDGVSAADQRSLIVYLTCRGSDLGLLGRGTFQRARALANRYGLGPGSLGVSTFTRRLDFDLGREVVD